MNPKTSLPLKLAAMTALVAGLAACDKTPNEPTVGQRVDSTLSSAEQQANETKNDIKQGTAEFRQDMKDAGTSATTTAQDAAITAGVNAELARDPALSALKIDVDTRDGKVRLQGTAPDADSRERATRLAQNVRGVTGVDNDLKVGG